MSEKSGLDLLSEVLDKLNMLEQKIDVLDQNVKKIANSAKMSELIDKAKDTPFAPWAGMTQGIPDVKAEIEKIKAKYGSTLGGTNAVSSAPTIKPFDPTEMLSKIKPVTKEEVLKNVGPRKTFVKGKVVVKSGETSVPVSLASVKIYDENDGVVKETRTNMAGEYSSMLSPGKYVAEIKGKYKDKDLVPQNISFIVNDGDKEVIIS